MPIAVLCPGCKAQFTVSDQFAGRTGPCPKCKQPITVPRNTVKAVTIHEPEAPAASSTAGGRPPLAPFRRLDKPIPAAAFAAIAVAGLATVGLAWLTRSLFAPGQPPQMLLAVGGFLVALPCSVLGYCGVRNRDLDGYRGRNLLVRGLICAAVYAGLWCVRGLLDADQTADMWPWLFLGPLFFVPGVITAMAVFDLDQGRAIAHFSLYVMFTTLLRWIVGLAPV